MRHDRYKVALHPVDLGFLRKIAKNCHRAHHLLGGSAHGSETHGKRLFSPVDLDTARIQLPSAQQVHKHLEVGFYNVLPHQARHARSNDRVWSPVEDSADCRIGHNSHTVPVKDNDTVCDALQDGLAPASFCPFTLEGLCKIPRPIIYPLVEFQVCLMKLLQGILKTTSGKPRNQSYCKESYIGYKVRNQLCVQGNPGQKDTHKTRSNETGIGS